MGRNVRLAGKILKIDGQTAIMETSDRGQIKLNLDQPLELKTVEIIGRVESDSITVLNACHFDTDFGIRFLPRL